MKKIYFIGRYTGHGIYRFFPFYKENYRPYEIEGISKSKNIQITNNIKNADIIMFRNKPEKTTDLHLKKFKSKVDKYHSNKVIINSYKSFYNFDSKERSYKIWRDHSLNAPDFLAFNYEELKNNKEQIINQINQFRKNKTKIFLRTNNETGSKGMLLVRKNDGMNYIQKCVEKLINRLIKISKNRSDSKLLAVEFLDSENVAYFNLYRAHVVGDEIVCFYALSSTKDKFHCKDMTMDDIDRFIKANADLNQLLRSNQKIKLDIINSLKVLGCNIGAIEFFIINDKIYFLELNPIWNGHAGRQGFGNEKFQQYLNKNKGQLESSIPNIYNFLNHTKFYQKLYDEISKIKLIKRKGDFSSKK